MQRAYSALGLLAAAIVLGFPVDSSAVPAFARQTGFPCMQCHTVAPELNAFGRQFKLNGFVLSTLPAVKKDDDIPVNLPRMPGVAAEADIADTFTKKGQPGSENANLQFPQKLKVFVAGALSDKAGVFSYVEYTQPDDHFSIDLTDVRYADHGDLRGTPVIYGLTVNNAPTLEDPWNTLNVWAFPHVHSEVAPGPAASTLLGGVLADSGMVAGLGGYGLLDDTWYGAVSVYGSAPTGAAQPAPSPNPGTVRGAVPYLRFAFQHSFGDTYLEAGASAMQAKFEQGQAGAGTAGLEDKYRDVSIDAQVEHPLDGNPLTFHARFITEKQTLDSSSAAGLSNGSDTLKELRADGTLVMRAGYAVSLGLFDTTGSSDPLLYAPGAVSGSATGKPDSNGAIIQGTYLPWENMQLVAQYTLYNKFNGGKSNYDGSGRSASDNNTLFLLLMFDL